MVVGFGDEPSLGDYERLLMSSKTTARKELILLHPTRYVTPGTTRKWLKERPWIHAHFHVELPVCLYSSSTQTNDFVGDRSSKGRTYFRRSSGRGGV